MNDIERQKLQTLVDRAQAAILHAEYAERTLGYTMDDLRHVTQAMRETATALQAMREAK